MTPRTFCVRFLALAGSLSLLGATTSILLAQAAPGSPVVILRGATVIDPATGSVPARRDLVIAGDWIVGLGTTRRSDVRVIDLTGKYIIPGLWDAHSHLDDFELWDFAPTEAEKERMLTLMVANGVTATRDVAGGLPFVPRARARAEAGALIAPRMWTAGPLIDGARPAWPTASVAVRDSASARQVVRDVIARGADFLKVYARLSPSEYRAVLGAAHEAGIRVAGHLPDQIRLVDAARAGQWSIEHMDFLALACSSAEDSVRAHPANRFLGAAIRMGGPALDSLFDRATCLRAFGALAAAGTWVTPTLSTLRALAEASTGAVLRDPRFPALPTPVQGYWHQQANAAAEGSIRGAPNAVFLEGLHSARRLLPLLKQAGVGLLVGTDMSAVFGCWPGSGVHEEMAEFVFAGLTPADALAAATINPARAMGLSDVLGEIRVGRLADLVILDANPLEDISNTRRIAGVVLRGRYYDRAALDQLRGLPSNQIPAARAP